MKKVLILGADGQLGVSVASLWKSDFEIHAYNRDALDVTNREQVHALISSLAPDYIVNAAAYNGVETAGSEIHTAYAVNAFAPFFLAESAQRVGAVLVHISTDHVFDGTKASYHEEDVPHPLNVYGASKCAGEELVRVACGSHYLVRTSVLFGYAKRGKKNFVDIMLEKGRESGEVRVVSDQVAAPTYSDDLAAALCLLVKTGAPWGTYHLVNEGSVSRAEFAKEIFAQAGVDKEVIPITTAETGTQVERPTTTTLVNVKAAKLGIVLPPWQDALSRYLARAHTS